MKILANNKKALFNYEVLKKYQAGIVLLGWEVKSIKNGHTSLKESYIKILNGEPIIENMHVATWQGIDVEEVDLKKSRKLLLHEQEISQLVAGVKIKGQTIIPLSLFLDKNRVKVEIALAKGKKRYDKRDKLKEKDQIRQIDRDLKYMGYN